MKPTPKSQHWLAVLLLIVASGTFGVLAFFEDRPTDTQIHLATSALKDSQTGLFSADAVYGDSGKWHMDSPVVIGMMKLVLVPTGGEDPILPFRLLTGVVAFIYLIGMYLLVFQQTRNWSISVFIALVSSAATELVPGLPWGAGALETTEPALICIAMLPLILLTYLRYEKTWQVVWVFAFIGLLANIHLSTAVNMLAVLWPVYLFRGRFSRRTLMLGGIALVAAATLALPYVAYLAALRATMPTAGADTGYKTAIAAMRLGGMDIFYPDLLHRLLEWRLLAALLAVGVPAVLVLGRWERYRVQNRSLWGGLIVSSAAVALLVHPMCQLIAKSSTVAPMPFTFFDAMRLMVLPMAVLLGQALTNVFRMGRYGPAFRVVILMVLLVWLFPSPNLRPARHRALLAITELMPAEERPPAVQRYGDRARRRVELKGIAGWLREESDINAVVLADNIRLRMLARRSTVICRDDLLYEYVLTPQDLKRWMVQVQEQLAVLYPTGQRAEGQMVRRYVLSLREGARFAKVTQWYLVTDQEVDFPAEQGFREIPMPAHWRFYKLYQLELSD